MIIDILSNLCIFFTIAVFSAGIPQCLQMVRQKSTNNVPFLPYVMTCFNNVAWILYSTLTGDSTVFIVNFIGFILQLVYIVVFFMYSASKAKEVQQLGTAGVGIVVCWVLIRYPGNNAMKTNVMGIICTVVTVLMFMSPLAELKTVINKRSTESLSFPLTVATFFCTILWTLYGIWMKDPYIVIPNVMGLMTSFPRFYLFAKYSKTNTDGGKLEVY